MSTRRIFLSCGLLAAVLGVNSTIAQPTAKKNVAPAAPTQTAKPAPQEDGPVAITTAPKRTPEKPVAARIGVKGEFSSFGAPVMNNRGDVAFLGRFLHDPAANKYGTGYFVHKANGEWSFVKEGDKGVNFDAPIIALGNLHLNNNGEMTFTGTIDKEAPRLGVTGSEANISEGMKLSGLFTKTAAGVKGLAYIGEEIPNNPAKFLGFASASTNSKGMMSFIGTYTDPDGRGLFIVEDGKFKLVARSGQRTPVGEDTSYSEHFYPSMINEKGEVAFYCRINGGGAIFVRRAKGIEAIAVQDKPSGAIDKSNFIGFGNRAPAINDNGDVVFVGFFDGENYGRGLFVYSNGKIKTLVRSGDTVPDSKATFTDFMMPTINSKGEVTFIATYAGRARGVFLLTAEGIEPIALYDKAVPGMPRTENFVFNNFNTPVINDNGDVSFLGQIRGAGVAIFYKKKGEELKILAKAGDQSPIK